MRWSCIICIACINCVTKIACWKSEKGESLTSTSKNVKVSSMRWPPQNIGLGQGLQKLVWWNNNLSIRLWSLSLLTVHLTHILSCLVPVGLDQLNHQTKHEIIHKGPSIYYVIQNWGLSRPFPPYCNIVINWEDPPPCNIVINWENPLYLLLK